jgi:hypothetical protein
VNQMSIAKLKLKPAAAAVGEAVTIKPPRLQTVEYKLTGSAPLVTAAFSEKARQKMMDTQRAGTQSRSKKDRSPRDFEADMQAAIHVAEEGWIGFPASAFRAAMISACRLVGYKMTLAKLAVFVEADGLDKVSGQPLVRLNVGKPELHVAAVRNANGGTDLRARPMWRKWSVSIRVKFDEDIFSLTDISNLLARVGLQVGIGEGRADSRDSSGMGWGSFVLEAEGE